MSKKIKAAYDCAVIGGGASGMMAAVWAARTGVKVVLIEHTKRMGSKILQTGNGKCNFTNYDMSKMQYQNEDKTFVMDVIRQLDVHNTIKFFQDIGVYHKEKNGYVYPNSETAASLQDALRMTVLECGVKVLEMCEVGDICCLNDDDERNQGENKENYELKTKITDVETDIQTDYIIRTKTVILATGSKAAPKTGSDGSGYKLSRKMGHSIIKPLPALVQLMSSDKLCKSMSGVRSTGRVCLYIDDKLVSEDTGEVQYTDYGISGIPVFQISRHAVKAVDSGKKAYAVVDMLPDMDAADLQSDCIARAAKESQRTVEQFFSGIVNKKLAYAAAKRKGVDVNRKISDMKNEKLGEIISGIINELKSFRIDINGFKDFSSGQICQGGVSLKEIDSATMKSKKKKGLYFAGELVDVDGRCGGYNLQWAWSSGYVAGVSAAKAVNGNVAD